MSTSGSTLSKLRESERETRRNLILDAAVRLFAARNFNQVGMRDIAAEVGISPPRFTDISRIATNLFLEALCARPAPSTNYFESLRERKADFTIEEAANEFVGYLLEHDSFFQMMIHFMTDGGISEEAIARSTQRKAISWISLMKFSEGLTLAKTYACSPRFSRNFDGILITFRKYSGRNAEETKKHVHRLATLMAEIFKKGADLRSTASCRLARLSRIQRSLVAAHRQRFIQLLSAPTFVPVLFLSR